MFKEHLKEHIFESASIPALTFALVAPISANAWAGREEESYAAHPAVVAQDYDYEEMREYREREEEDTERVYMQRELERQRREQDYADRMARQRRDDERMRE